MYQLKKRFTFEASHRLPNHDGKCARLHGHSWVGWLILEGPALVTKGPKAGMLIDYGDISDAIKPIVEQYLDHRHLNESTGLVNPTSEELAYWIFEMVQPRFNDKHRQYLKAVIVEETCTSACEYRPQPKKEEH